MSRFKLNSTHVPFGTGLSSDLYRAFKEPFDALMRRSSPGRDRSESEQFYVPVRDAEKALRSAIAGPGEKSIRCFTGFTGEGKSTVLRHTFEFNDVCIIKPELKRLIIPISFDSLLDKTDDNPAQHFSACFQYSSRLIMQTYNVGYSDEELIDYIMRTRPTLLHRSPEARPESSPSALYESARRHDRPACEAILLKMLLAKVSLSEIVIIVDDIESLPYARQLDVVGYACGTLNCLERAQANYSVTLLIGCRESSRSLLRRESALSMYNFDPDICLNNDTALERLFDARLVILVRHIARENREKWDRAKEIVKTIAKLLSERYGIMLLDLCNRNYRDAMSHLTEILSNRKWFQQTKPKLPHFESVEHEYALNEAAVFRALGLGGGEMSPASRTPFVNLLHNQIDQRSDLLVCYVIRYLLQRPGNRTSMCKFKSDADAVFELFPDPVSWELVADAVEFMMDSGLIFQDHIPDGNVVITLTPKASLLWRLLQQNAMLLQFYREDTFLDFADRLSSTEPSEVLHAAPLFRELARIASLIIQTEWRQLQMVQSGGALAKYRHAFGTQLVGELLFHGLNKSVHSYRSEEHTSELQSRFGI